jgi:hypothetical protein
MMMMFVAPMTTFMGCGIFGGKSPESKGRQDQKQNPGSQSEGLQGWVEIVGKLSLRPKAHNDAPPEKEKNSIPQGCDSVA